MKIGLILSAAALCVAAVAVAAMPVQDAKAKAKPDDKMMGDKAAMDAAWTKAAELGPQHAELKKMVGNWTTHVKDYGAGPDKPLESDGTTTYEMALGDRFLIEHSKGSMGGMPFEGLGILGYNNITGQYDSVWLDNMGTQIMVSHGTKGADGAVTFKGDMDNPMGGGKMPVRFIVKHADDNHSHFEMYASMGGPEMKVLEMDSTRSGGASR